MIRMQGCLLMVAAACGGGGGTAQGDAGAADVVAAVDAKEGDARGVARVDVEIVTEDGLRLTGYWVSSGSAGAGPAVLLVHQYLRDDEQWGELPERLAALGHRVLAFNLRGHGDSDPYPGGSLDGILTDPDGAPRDVRAALAHLRARSDVDATRIAVVGTSIGANLAVASSIHGEARTYVAFSARRAPTESLAAAPATTMASVLYVAGENDPGGQAADAQTLHDATTPPREIVIYAGTADHGVAILENQADAESRLFAWLALTL